MRLSQRLTLKRALKKLRSHNPRYREGAETYFKTASPEVKDQLEVSFDRHWRVLKRSGHLLFDYVLCIAFCVFVFILVYIKEGGYQEIAFLTSMSLSAFGLVFSSQISNFIKSSSVKKLKIISEALALSGNFTPSAFRFILEHGDEKLTRQFTPVMVESLSSTSPLSFEDQKVYFEAASSLPKHLSTSRIQSNLPLALALVRFYAKEGNRAVYPFLSLSISAPPQTVMEKEYHQAAIPLVREMEKRYFSNLSVAEYYLHILPASYSWRTPDEKRIAIHALAYLLPKLAPEQAGFIKGDLKTKMLRYLNSDPAYYPPLHLAIIDFIDRAQMLEALSALERAAEHTYGHYSENQNGEVYSRVRNAAKSTLDRLKAIAAQKEVQNILLRAGVPDDNLLRAPNAKPDQETERLLRISKEQE